MINATIVGNVVKDAVVRDAGSMKVCSFCLACRTGKKDTSGNYITEFVDCSLWGKRGETMAPYIKSGMSITALGGLSVRRFDFNGEKRAALNMDVQDLNFNSRPAANTKSDAADSAPAAPVADGDDLPF